MDSLPEATLLAAELIRPTLSSTHPSAPRLLGLVAVINAGLRSFGAGFTGCRYARGALPVGAPVAGNKNWLVC